jgi:hypothetical protein
MRSKQILALGSVLLVSIATVPGQQPRRHVLTPMYAGFTIHQAQRYLNAFGEPQRPLHGWKRTIARNANGVEAISYDTTLQPDVVGNRTLFWPKDRINVVIMDKWRAVQTTQALPELSLHGFGERTPLFHCEALHPNNFDELFSGYVELHGVSVAHIIRTKPSGQNKLDKIDAYYWEEADCLLVQEITSRFAGDELIVSSGWELESIENGKSDPKLFEIPKDYREGSMLQFASEFGRGSASTGFFNQPVDPYDQMKAPRPAP